MPGFICIFILTHLPRLLLQDIVTAMFDVIKEEVAAGKKVSLQGIGWFERRIQTARTARNPINGEAI